MNTVTRWDQSRVLTRARHQIPRLDSPVVPSSQDRRHLSSGRGRASPPLHLSPGKGKLGGKTRLPMVRKIIQWVPIDGTRWRNEFVNGHENRGVGLHYGVAHCGVMPTQMVIGSGPSKGICSQYASLNPEDARSNPTMHPFVGEDASGSQKTRFSEIRRN